MPSRDIVLAIDQGTTGTTAVLVDPELCVIAKHNEEFPQIYPQPGWVEHDLEDIWKTVHRSVARVLASAKIDASRIAAIGITNQRETIGVWDRRTHRPLYNAIVWQCRRTALRCEALRGAQGRGAGRAGPGQKWLGPRSLFFCDESRLVARARDRRASPRGVR